MKFFKLVSAVAILILFASPDVILIGGLSRAVHAVGANTLQTDDSAKPVADQSLALFMPAGYQVTINVASTYDEGC
ncbi:MAG: hypothetical protein OEY87_10500 [Gammaproteobacteria bacterium]|nr:hypothetical protein [Gammaproteobacteria bacterium]MDH5736539.1 hypothetical protein [Gammaproteobacteria bacterium]